VGYDMYIEGALEVGAKGLSNDDEPGYFRLNIFGMSRYRDYMDELGMLDWQTSAPDGEGYEDFALDEPTGIPGYKFCSNDGWLVTPAEIRVALALAESSGKAAKLRKQLGEDADYWAAWIKYLQRAEQAEGFRVW
jgi:hypothetical protein